MIVLGSFLMAIAQILHLIITAYIFVIIACALLSWVNPDPFNKIVQILYRLSAPAYALVRKTRIPTVFGGIDLAPLIIILGLQFVDIFLMRLFSELARAF